MPAADAHTVDNHYLSEVRQTYQKQSFFARYLSPHNPFSLVGMMSAQVPGSFADAFTSTQAFFGQIGKIFQPYVLTKTFSMAVAGAAPRAYADTTSSFDPYDGLTQWGFTPDELNKMRNDPSYSIAQNLNYISSEQIAKYDSTIGKCFDPAKSQTDTESDHDCSPDNKMWDNDQVFRYRLYKLDSNIADSAQENLSGGTTN